MLVIKTDPVNFLPIPLVCSDCLIQLSYKRDPKKVKQRREKKYEFKLTFVLVETIKALKHSDQLCE